MYLCLLWKLWGRALSRFSDPNCLTLQLVNLCDCKLLAGRSDTVKELLHSVVLYSTHTSSQQTFSPSNRIGPSYPQQLCWMRVMESSERESAFLQSYGEKQILYPSRKSHVYGWYYRCFCGGIGYWQASYSMQPFCLDSKAQNLARMTECFMKRTVLSFNM